VKIFQRKEEKKKRRKEEKKKRRKEEKKKRRKEEKKKNYPAKYTIEKCYHVVNYRLSSR
jgi:hypothetical protein